MVSYSFDFEFANLPFIDDISYSTYPEVLFLFKQYIITFIL